LATHHRLYVNGFYGRNERRVAQHSAGAAMLMWMGR